jgi:hypothetical protein
MGQELTIPAGFKGPAQAFAAAGLNAQTDNLTSGIGQSYGVINYKGKVWSLRYRGERKTFIRADDGTPANYLDVIILGQAPSKSKSFYAKYDPNSGDSGERPICSSIDGVLPDDDVTTEQSPTCALCPRNVWKTDATTGRRGRECQDYKRLAVLVLPTQTKLILGSALMEPVFLRVPAASLNSLAILGETMSKQGYHYASYITRITFDPQKSWPEMQFRPVQELTNAEAPVILELMGNMLVERITVGDGSRRKDGLQVVNQPVSQQGAQTVIAPAEAPPFTAPPANATSAVPPTIIVPAATQTAAAVGPMTMHQNSPAAVSAPVAIDSGLQTTGGVSTGFTSETVQHHPDAWIQDMLPASADNGIVSGGASGAIPVSPPPPASNGVLNVAPGPQNGISSQSIPDAGVAEESDTDLDNRIAGILANK